MRLTIRLLGLDEVLGEEAGECTTYPVGFTQSPSDQRWESAPELQ